MNLVDVLLMLQREKNSFDWSRLKEEYSRQGELIRELEQARGKLQKIMAEIKTCREENEKTARIIYSNLKKIEEIEDPYTLINIINEEYIELEKCKKVVEEILNAKIQKYREIINMNNEKLKLYSKIFMTILGKTLEIQFFQADGDIKQLEKNAKLSQDLVSKVYETMKEELKSVKIDEDKLNLLIQLINDGQIVITRKNVEKIVELLKFLSSRGIVLTVKV